MISIQDSDWLQSLPAQCDCLYPYQIEQIANAYEAMTNGRRRILMQLPTGGGKTHEMCAIVAAAVAAGLPVLLLATRTQLVRQIHERLEAFGIEHGVIAAALPELANPAALVQVASVDTLVARCIRGSGKAGKMPIPTAAVVLFDEAHLALADTRMALLCQYPESWLFGFTATPARKDGRPLGALFDELILGIPMRELIKMGKLVPMRIFDIPAVTPEQLAALPKDANKDYQAGASGKLMSDERLLGNVFSNWDRITGRQRKTLVFACDKAHGRALLEVFLAGNVAAEMLSDEDGEPVREAAMARLASGKTLVLINCFLLAYGVDIPAVDCVVLASFTRSVVMYLQKVGRGTRASVGKTHCLLIDHGRIVDTLGLPTDDFAWSLAAGANVNEAAENQQKKKKRRKCKECGFIWEPITPEQACPECGTPPETARDIEAIEAELQERTPAPELEPMQQFFCEALGDYVVRYPDRWQMTPKKGRWAAWHTMREKFGVAPSARAPGWIHRLTPRTPSSETAAYLKERRRAYMKQKQEQMRLEFDEGAPF